MSLQRYNIMSYISYDFNKPLAEWEDYKDDDGRFILHAELCSMTATEVMQAWTDAQKHMDKLGAKP